MEHKAFIELVRGAIDKLEVQGEPSYGDKGYAYLDPHGRCCIVGFMMPDDETRRQADDRGPDDSLPTNIYALAIDRELPWAKQFDAEQLSVLISLQDIHDNMACTHKSTYGEQFNQMRRVVAEYNGAKSNA
ncbi:MAG: hypothetical protein B7X50_07965 [Alishewanella sp. 34-51-39]|nr:MAG: hypothetical protein B7X50_07965 [Alishewanella sp. 34-51-39]